MVCTQVMGNDTTVAFAGSQGHFELNVYKPVMALNVLESAQLIGDACLSFDLNCAQGIIPDTDRVDELLNNSLMLVTSLNPKIGYYKAAEIAKLAHQNKLTLKKAAIQTGYLTEAEFEEWVQPQNMIGRD